ncbi:prefoldin subunit 5 [Tetranychus urticae]|uniref:Prefoldin subunit 5 n=1 Tax=Tetranychus urticae TaxID=32264 RepID=T1KSG7_TETUR|nr:prefoldin subunit 5 [Tetranychus urticae]
MATSGKIVDLSSELSIPQLSGLKQQLDQEVELLATSIQQLQNARIKYQESGECVSSQAKVPKNSEILVPLTASMYVNGTIVDNDRFLIDIGTGYYIERNREATIDYFKRKVEFLNKEIEKFAKIAQEKINIRESVIEALVYKQQAALLASKAQAQ